jgi:selenide, water dikinase
LRSGEVVAFDVCSLAVGSAPAGLDTPGAAEHAVPLKPLHRVQQIVEQVDALAERGSGAVSIVGGGLAGVEMALAVRSRLSRQRGSASAVAVGVISRETTLASGRSRSLSRKLAQACARHGISLHLGSYVQAVTPSAVTFANGVLLPSDLTIWATGPSAVPWLAASGLTVDPRGFVLVDDFLRSTSHAHVFAAGDCATLDSARGTPKAGVYAVRMGPFLARGLAAALRGTAPRERFVPQSRWLALVNTGDGGAIASYGPFALSGEWAMRWKDRIDQTFIARFTDDARYRRAVASQ